ncbi:hypothetical protein [Limnofasciculus baicalensis]|uniref:Uncharacterized protein n=1 Tax=Limnofasciculus baicalensis BBK-W-15 TaxID=2699891 RepID=A0AAE3GNN9_9CYAN|nr:hypothetical protein [Limnofasciculus baicalensis]MCP2727916.1 hypothetical protein [Limnofasciculus baicalensis BBK-W-15]
MTTSSKLTAGFPTSTSKAVNWKVYQFSSSNLTPNQSFNSPPVPKEVQLLVQELAKFDGVARVRAVAPRAADIHWIDFELELHPETELDYETWDKIQDLVIDCAWNLRDKTNEKWYFDEKVVEKFVKIQEWAKVVAQSSISYSSSPKYYIPEKSSSNFLVVA